jgi:hypothetical protein
MAGEEEARRPLRLWRWNAQPATSLSDVPRWIGWLGFAAALTIFGGPAFCYLAHQLGQRDGASLQSTDEPYSNFRWQLVPWALLAGVLYLLPILGFAGLAMPLLLPALAAPLVASLVVAHVANLCYKQGLRVGAQTRLAPESLVTTGVRTWTLTGAVFLSTLALYYLTRGLTAVANNPIRLADAFLHGRLDIANGAELQGYLDYAFYEGKYFVLEPPAMAFVVLPGEILFGLALNQTLVSIVIGSLTVAAVYRLIAGLTEKLSVQIWLTVLFGFGTIFWWTATQGGIWYFAHAVSVLFLVVAIYETLIGKRPFSAGLFLGASYLARLPVILAFPFFLIMFSDLWLRQADRNSAKDWIKSINWRPLLLLGLGVGIPLVFSFVYNYARFEDPLNSGYTVWADFQGPRDAFQGDTLCLSRTPTGLCLFDVEYAARSIPVFFQAVPVFTVGQGADLAAAPYVYPSWSGMAFWATTPAFLYALFAGIRSKAVTGGGIIAVSVSIVILVFAARGLGWLGFAYDAGFHYRLRFGDLTDFLYDVTIYPFLLLMCYVLLTGIPKTVVRRGWFVIACILLFFGIIGPPLITYALLLWLGAGALISIVYTLTRGTGDKLVLACWAAIIPIAIVHFIYPITGWPMLGFRYMLDYVPFVLLLTWVGMRDQIKWHQALLIAASIIVSGAGVFWINIFDSRDVFFEPGTGIRWVNW